MAPAPAPSKGRSSDGWFWPGDDWPRLGIAFERLRRAGPSSASSAFVAQTDGAAASPAPAHSARRETRSPSARSPAPCPPGRTTPGSCEPSMKNFAVRAPLRPTDDVSKFWRIDPEDLDDIAYRVAHRARRSMDTTKKNPWYDRVFTIEDMILFFEHQPKLPNEAPGTMSPSVNDPPQRLESVEQYGDRLPPVPALFQRA